MTKLEQAARQALDALEELHYSSGTVVAVRMYESATAALREALKVTEDNISHHKLEQEPVAWAHPSGGHLSARYMKEFATGLEKETHTIPLYAEPVRTKDLTDDDLFEIANKVGFDGELMKMNHDRGMPSIAEQYARAVIKKFKEKNNANNNT